MPASFPSSLKSFVTREIGDTIAASHINDLQLEVAAIESDLLNATPTFLSTVTSGINATALSTGTIPDGRIVGAYTGVTSLAVGANVSMNTTTLLIGNSTVNTVMTATTVTINGASVATTGKAIAMAMVFGG